MSTAAKQTYIDRPIPKISLANFESRIDAIAAEVAAAAENIGFFGIVDHGISAEDVDQMFADSEAFFSLPAEVKASVPWNPQNVGYEFKSQVRPSTNAAYVVAFLTCYATMLLTMHQGPKGVL
jgi:isopenicillin N synthase-like dioxygenase